MPERLTVTALVCALWLAGCETQPTHEVLTLTDMTPRQVEIGDRIEVRGNGIPMASDIRRITLQVRGSIARPGMPRCDHPVAFTLSDPPEGAEAIDPATGEPREVTYAETAAHVLRVDGASRMEFIVTTAMLSALTECPSERTLTRAELAHATLSVTGARGGVSVRIETMQGTTLASARALRGPVIDLHPMSSMPLGMEIEARGAAEHALSYMGLQLAGVHPAEGGLQVERVLPGSPGDEAGIVDGDVLLALDGVHLLTLTDARPAPGATVAVLSVRRGDAVDDHPVRIDRLDRSVPSDWIATGVLLVVALAALALFMLPTPGIATWLRRRIARGWRGLEDGAAWRKSPVVRQTLVLAGAATLSSMPLGTWWAGGRVDLATLFAALVVTGTLGVLWRARSALALWRFLSQQVPAALALAAVSVATGSARLEALCEAQGGYPWQWNLLRSPVLFALFIVWSASLVAEIESLPEAPGDRSIVARLGVWKIFDGGLRFGAAIVGAGLFLGGWSLPSASADAVASSTGLQMLGTAWMVAKAWGLFFTGVWVKGALRDVSSAQRTTLCWRFLTPIGALAAAGWIVGAIISLRLSRPVVEVASTACAWAMSLVVGFGLVWSVARRVVVRLRPAAAYVPDAFE